MATKTLYLVDAMVGEFHGMQDGGTAPATANFVNFRANLSKAAANNYWEFQANRTNPTNFGTTDPLATPAVPSDRVTGTANAGGDGFVTQNPLTGTFANTNWTFTVKVRPSTVSTQSVQFHYRVWKGPNADGSGATELTSAVQTGATTGSMNALQDYDTSFTWTPGAAITFNNEYLFLQISIKIMTAGGSNGADVRLRQGVSFITTPDFSVSAALTATGFADSSPVLDTPALGQTHVIPAATALAVSSPASGTPIVSMIAPLPAATALTDSSPALGTPAVGQTHALAASAFTDSSPALDTPLSGGTNTLTASSLAVGSPVPGAPVITQVHPLLPQNLEINFAGTGWVPTDLAANLIEWFDASDGASITISSGSKVSQWGGKSGNGHDATQTNDTYRPLYNLAPSRLTFSSGSSGSLVVTSPPNGYVAVIAARSRPDNGNWRTLISHGGNANTVLIQAGGILLGTYVNGFWTAGSLTWENDTGHVLSSYVPQAPEYIAIGLDGGALQSTGHAGGQGTNLNFIGDYAVGGGQGFGDIYEIIVMPEAISTFARQQAEGYLAWKWGFQANLPTDHPYYAFSPAAPVFGSPLLTIRRDFTATNIAVGSPGIGAPVMVSRPGAEINVLGSTSLEVGSPVLDTPALTWQHGLRAEPEPVVMWGMGNAIISGGGLTIEHPAAALEAGAYGNARTLSEHSGGKFYLRVKNNSAVGGGGDVAIGVGNAAVYAAQYVWSWVGDANGGLGQWGLSVPTGQDQTDWGAAYVAGASVAFGEGVDENAWWTFAIDFDAKKYWYKEDGESYWVEPGGAHDPVTGAGGYDYSSYTFPGPWYIWFSVWGSAPNIDLTSSVSALDAAGFKPWSPPRAGIEFGTSALTAEETFPSALPITVGSPVIGTPAIAQVHGLAASSLTASSPSVPSVALVEMNIFTATTLAASAPVLGAPTTTQVHVLAATGIDTSSPVIDTPGMAGAPVPLTVGSPEFGAPALAQTQALAATSLDISSPSLPTPAMVVVRPLVATALEVGSPVFEAPATTQAHALAASALADNSPAFGSPAVAQTHVIIASDLADTSPVLDTPTFSQNYVLGTVSLEVGSPVLDTPAAASQYAFTANNLSAGSPVFGTPDMTAGAGIINLPPATTLVSSSPYQEDKPLLELSAAPTAFSAADLQVGSPVFDAPALLQEQELIANALASGSPVHGTPTLAQVHVNTASALADTSPAFGMPVFAQGHTLAGAAFSTGSPVLGVPAAQYISNLTASTLETDAPDMPTPNLLQVQVLAGASMAVGSPVTGTSAIGQTHALAGSTMAPSSPVLGLPSFAQAQVLIPASMVSGRPFFGSPSLAGITAFEPFYLDSSPPVFGTPAIAQTHVIVPASLVDSSPALGTPALVRVVHLAPSGFAVGSPVLDTPAFTRITIDIPAAVALETSAPEFGEPDLVTVIHMAGVSMEASPPTFGTPALVRVVNFSAIGLAVGTPTLGAPSLVQNVDLMPEALEVGSPVLPSVVFRSRHILLGQSLPTGPPVIGTPVFQEIKVFHAQALTTARPTLGTPALAQRQILTANNLTTGSPVLPVPSWFQIAQGFAAPLSVQPPAFGTPVLRQRQTLIPNWLTTLKPQLGTPAINQTVWLWAESRGPFFLDLHRPQLHQVHALGVRSLQTSSPIFGVPRLKGEQELPDPLSLVVGSPEIGQPTLAKGTARGVFVSAVGTASAVRTSGYRTAPATVLGSRVLYSVVAARMAPSANGFRVGVVSVHAYQEQRTPSGRAA